MLKKIINIIAFLVVAGGIVLLCYPSFAGYINQKYANNEISEYQNEIKNYNQQKLEQIMQTAYDYNAKLPGAYPADPFEGSNISNLTDDVEFQDFSLLQQGAMLGYVDIPKIDVYLPIYYGTDEKVLKDGTGLVENTSLPVGGSGTHAVISGHTGMASKKIFTDLNLMKEKDVFFLHVLNQDFAYQVDQIKVVLPHESEELKIQEGKDYVTLLTCTPFGVNDHRLLVRGKRIDYDFSKKEVQHITPETAVDKYLWMFVIGVIGFITLISIFIKIWRKRRDMK